MANPQKFGARGSIVTAIAGASSAPTLKNLSSGSYKLGNEIDLTGSGSRYLESNWQLKLRAASSAFAVGDYCDLYILPKVNGQYPSGSDSVLPASAYFAGRFEVREAVTTQLYINLAGIALPNSPFKPLLTNNTTRGLTNTDNENVLSYEPYDIEMT